MRPMIRKTLAKEVEGIDTIEAFQSRIEKYMKKNLDETISELTVSGLENLQKDKAHCFISNHRDIAMDPAFVNWVLYHNGFKTLRIAIGDNLLTKPFASDLMRLNKSFIVNRSAKAPKEKFRAAKKLSNYIQHSIAVDNANIWIAQREGRAKDGLDITNSAIISMLALSRSKKDDFQVFLDNINIVPVSISYEFDPCDEDKARELTIIDSDGSYKKGPQEDVSSIAKGIVGEKGRVHLSFGEIVGKGNDRLESVEDVVDFLDKTILGNYVLQPTNCIAYEYLEKRSPLLPVTHECIPFKDFQGDDIREKFERRLNHCGSRWREKLLRIYANPVYAKLALAEHA